MWMKTIVNIRRQASNYGTIVPSLLRSIRRLDSAASREQIVEKAQTRSFADAAKDAPTSAHGRNTAGTNKKGSKASTSGKPHPISEEFKVAWKKVAPLFDVPKIPTDFLDDRPGPTPEGPIPAKLTINFVLPSRAEMMSHQVLLYAQLIIC
jgi:hypothetical protein